VEKCGSEACNVVCGGIDLRLFAQPSRDDNFPERRNPRPCKRCGASVVPFECNHLELFGVADYAFTDGPATVSNRQLATL
jgi:hypothetical protein